MRGKVDTRVTVRRRFLFVETEFTNGRTLKAKSSRDVFQSVEMKSDQGSKMNGEGVGPVCRKRFFSIAY